MVSDRNAAGIVGHLVAIGAACCGLVWAWARPDSATLILIAALLLAGAAVSFVRLLGQHDRDLARFIEAIGHGDLSQRFGPGVVGDALDAAMQRLRDDRHIAGEEGRFQRAMIEETPVPLVTIGSDRMVRLLNKAARDLFGERDGRPLADFAEGGSQLVATLDPAGLRLGRALVSFATATGEHRAVATVTEVVRGGRPLRLVAIEPIGRELDAAEVAAQADLVRVLTHEIMNSMTPITSLARSAATLMARIPDPGAEALDAKRAIDIVADRATGLLGFVGSYRQYATLPLVARRRFDAAAWAGSVVDLFREAGFGPHAVVAIEIRPPGLSIDADPDLLLQAVLNLLKNAAEAGAGRVTLVIARDGDGVAIAVEDDGSGIGDEVAADMFLPFFTSKPTGTGIGLSLARQVAVAHEGSITAGRGTLGGAVLRIRLPG